MSGFAAIFHLDGAPVDRAWLESMAEFLAFRGPDAREVRVLGSAGLCQTLLRTSAETDGRPVISSLDDQVWLAGDVRIDDRETLLAKLPNGVLELKKASSAELILHAYAHWGESCLDHLLGDFSFAIWDSRLRRVFAARDHFGVRPLFYAQVGQCLLISNTLDCIRQIPFVPNELNERAIGDFLLVGQNRYPSETFFAAIHRLPVAHSLSAGREGISTQRYWTLAIDEPLFFKRAEDYVDRFRELMRSAVGDRLPDGPLGVSMSGGLDSPLLAATAVQLGAATTALTHVFDRLIQDEERHHAGLVAQHLGIPIRYRVAEDESWGWEPDSIPIHTPDPCSNPLGLLALKEHHRAVSGYTRVILYGLGPDDSLAYEWKPYLNHLIRQRRWGRVCRDLVSEFAAHPRIPLVDMLSRKWKERNEPDWYTPSFPSWFNKDFEDRIRLRDRWEEIGTYSLLPHPTRPVGYTSFAGSFPMGGLDIFDAGNTGAPCEYRHPFFDIRLLRFLLAVPAIPWCRHKQLIRSALRGMIPEEVRLRPKAPLNGFPELLRIRQSGYPSLPPIARLEEYVDRNQVTKGSCHESAEIERELKILGLQLWLLDIQSNGSSLNTTGGSQWSKTTHSN